MKIHEWIEMYEKAEKIGCDMRFLVRILNAAKKDFVEMDKVVRKIELQMNKHEDVRSVKDES